MIEKDSKEVSENKKTIQTKTVYDLSELKQLKTKQLKKYEAILTVFKTPNSIELFIDVIRQEMNNLKVTRRNLAIMIVKRFNKSCYTSY